MAMAAPFELTSRIRKPSPVVAPEAAALSRVTLLSELPPGVQAALMVGAAVRRLSRRGVLSAEGTVPSHVVVVISGRMRAVRRSSSGREVTLETFQAGDVLADGVLVPERPLRSDWEAVEPTEVLLLARDAFRSQVQTVPALALSLASRMFTRLDRSTDLAAGLALADVPGRVIGALRSLAASQGEAGPDGVVVHNRPTQQEMANSIGACRETVSRVVSDLARRGLITPRGRSLLISRRLLDAGA